MKRLFRRSNLIVLFITLLTISMSCLLDPILVNAQAKTAFEEAESKLGMDKSSKGKKEEDKKKKSKPKVHRDISGYIDEFKDPTKIEGEGFRIGGTQVFAAVVGDFAQAVAQVILDKATTAAFDILKKQVMEKLKCTNDCSENNIICFHNTCKVIKDIRFHEIITDKNVLFKAFIQDILLAIKTKLVKEFAAEDSDIKYLKLIIMDILFQKLSDINKPIDTVTINLIVQSYLKQYINELDAARRKDVDKNITELENETKINLKKKYVAALAALAVWRAKVSSDQNETFRKASIQDILDNIIRNIKCDKFDKEFIPQENSEEYFKTLKIALMLHKAMSISKAKNLRDGLNHAVDALFETIFLVKGISHEDKNKFLYPKDGILKGEAYIFIIKEIIDGAINKDINSIINMVGLVLQGHKDKSKAIRLIGAVLLYAQTYTDTDLDGKTAQAKRTQIIKSLVMERKARDRFDVVFSFGGSLRGILQLNSWKKGISTGINDLTGVETVESKSTHGPFSVPIGLGIDWYLKKSFGLHLEFDIIDLGHFTSFEGDTGVVEKPRISDIFAPSATAGLFYGKAYLLYAGVTYGYSPKYYNPEADVVKKGSLNLGFTLGIYIPLIDFN